MDLENDHQALRQLFADLATAWNRGDEQQYGVYFTEDCDYVTYQGQHVKGRQATADLHRQLFKELLRGSTLVGFIQSIRFLGPDTALVHAVGGVKLSWQKQIPERRASINTHVVVRQGDAWKITAFHNCRIQKPGLIQKVITWLVR